MNQLQLMGIIKKTPLYHPLRNWTVKQRQKKEFVEWKRKGKPTPPPHIVKQRTLVAYAKRFGIMILVETGTFYGDMVEAMKKDFDRIYSIELDRQLYESAKQRFNGEEKIELLHGDSGIMLGDVINRLDRPALFWLDGHYSAGATARGDQETPIYAELNHILSARDKGHVIIIDDARCFGSNPAYPSIEKLNDLIKVQRPDAYIVVKDDSIRITPER